jgi:phosphate starvation-inducible PhoH-like protein
MVITGDVSQIDLPEDKTSGLKVAMKVLDGIDDVAICTLTGADVVRHRLVQRIIESYEEYEKKQPKTPEPGRPAAVKKYRRRPER